jgi:hypothetical protein
VFVGVHKSTRFRITKPILRYPYLSELSRTLLHWCTTGVPECTQRYSEQEIEGWKEEVRQDTIIMSLTQHIPELEAATEPREAFEPTMQA